MPKRNTDTYPNPSFRWYTEVQYVQTHRQKYISKYAYTATETDTSTIFTYIHTYM